MSTSRIALVDLSVAVGVEQVALLYEIDEHFVALESQPVVRALVATVCAPIVVRAIAPPAPVKTLVDLSVAVVVSPVAQLHLNVAALKVQSGHLVG